MTKTYPVGCKSSPALKGHTKGANTMDCPWYLGFQATEECIKNCTITAENRDDSICPESAGENDDFDMM